MSNKTTVKPIHAREGEIVEIHWHCPETIYVKSYTCPPKATRDSRITDKPIDQGAYDTES